MDMLKLIWFLIIFVSIISVEIAGRTSLSGSEEDEELEKQLKLLNKPASKTIKTEHGDIIDCVDIYKQPSLDHPVLKNHTIQMEPSAFPEELRGQGTPLSSSSSSSNLMEIKPTRLTCPRGTVPIPRIQKEDLIRIRSLPKTTEANTYNPSDDNDIHVTHFADCHTPEDPNNHIHGASAMFSIYNPKLATINDFSGVSIWIQNFQGNKYNSIRAGWIVNPNLYGDNKTRLYTRWTVDWDDHTGCYNTLCPGFIQVGSVPLNQVLNQPTHGDLQNTLDLLVFKDPKTKNWWLTISKSRTLVGYWPANLFDVLKDNAQRIAWGAFAYSPGNEAALEMGSGQFKSNDQENTCFAGGLQVIDEFNHYRDPSKFKIDTYSDKPQCYGVEYRGNTKGEIGYNVLFGGPGGLKCGN